MRFGAIFFAVEDDFFAAADFFAAGFLAAGFLAAVFFFAAGLALAVVFFAAGLAFAFTAAFFAAGFLAAGFLAALFFAAGLVAFFVGFFAGIFFYWSPLFGIGNTGDYFNINAIQIYTSFFKRTKFFSKNFSHVKSFFLHAQIIFFFLIRIFIFPHTFISLRI